jgi:hypothetical protein
MSTVKRRSPARESDRIQYGKLFNFFCPHTAEKSPVLTDFRSQQNIRVIRIKLYSLIQVLNQAGNVFRFVG